MNFHSEHDFSTTVTEAMKSEQVRFGFGLGVVVLERKEADRRLTRYLDLSNLVLLSYQWLGNVDWHPNQPPPPPSWPVGLSAPQRALPIG